MSVEAREALAAKRRGNGGEASRMMEGWRRKVSEAREYARRYDREIEWAGVTFAPEDVVELLKGLGYGG